MTEKESLVLKFDPNTIQHLGISLYSQLPNVLAELISNSWDADAENIFMDFRDDAEIKSIIYKDDGVGMDFQELNEKYLLIGRNRRQKGTGQTAKGRKVIGKKGLGKLSVFGICDEIHVKTIKDGKLNEFSMNLHEIKRSTDSAYNPSIIHHNQPTELATGTELVLNYIRRKSPFDCQAIAQSLSKKFLVFDKVNTSIFHNGAEELTVTNELKFDGFSAQFTWEFPNESMGIPYEHAKDISGLVMTLHTPIKDTEMKGIYLTSRGKLVNPPEFYGLRDTDLFHSYVTGYLEVDFIDELDEDVISTDRKSLNWENNETRELKSYVQQVIQRISSDWRKKRASTKKEDIKVAHGVDVDIWQSGLPTYEKELSSKIIDPILENSSIDTKDSSEIINSVINKFENKTFKEYADKIASLNKPDEIPMLLKLMDEWKAIEYKQYSDLALSRIEVITKFEEYIRTDTKEVPTLHNFLKQFSWLLDPRILEFRDEVYYSRLLKETYPDDELEEDDRRIDFLCSNALGGILYVIEIKRSKYKVDMKALEQAWDYGAFLADKFASVSGFSKVVSFVVGGEKSSNPAFKRKENTYRDTGEVFVKTYPELLEQSKQYHKEFIELHKSSLK